MKKLIYSYQKSKSEVYDFIIQLPKANYQKDGLTIQRELRNEWLNRDNKIKNGK